MSRRKVVVYNQRTGAYQGQMLTDEVCAKLDMVIQAEEDVQPLQLSSQLLYDLPPDVVEGIAESRRAVAPQSVEYGVLRDYQVRGVAFMGLAKRCILGDSVGLGKTVQLAALYNLVRLRRGGERVRMLFLTDKTVVPQVCEELMRFTGEFVFSVTGEARRLKELQQLYGVDAEPSLADPLSIVVGSHSVGTAAGFYAWLDEVERELGSSGSFFDVLVVDESAVLGSTTSQVYKQLKSRIADKVEYCVLMNATTFEINLLKFYHQLAFVDSTLLPKKSDFYKDFCYMCRSRFGDFFEPTGRYKNADIFRHRVRYRYFARTREHLGYTFEGCSAIRHVVPLSDVQRALMRKVSQHQLVADDPTLLVDGLVFSPSSVPKILRVLDLLTGALDDSVPGNWGSADTVIMFCHYKEPQKNIYDILQLNGISCSILNGDTSSRDRKTIIDDFKSGKFRVLITNVMKGLNFGDTHHIMIYSMPGNVNNIVQFEGRTTRSKDVHNKHLAVLVSEGWENSKFEDELRYRARASHHFAGSDYSLIMSLMEANTSEALPKTM